MRTFTFIATVVVLLANAMYVAKSHADWPQTTMQDPRWSVEIGGLAYDRPGTQLALPLITDGVTNATLFDSNQATDLGSTFGADVKLNWVSRGGRELQLRSIIADWDTSTEVTGTLLRSPFIPVPGPSPTTVHYGYDSDYFSIELMERRAISPGITCAFGPRYVSTKDRVAFTGSRDVNPGGGLPQVTVSQTTSTEATNGLIGFQGGLEFNMPATRDVYFNGFIRAGGYYNPTEVTRSVSDNVGSLPVVSSQTKSTGSFLGEVGGRMYVDIVPSCFALYIGYEATWIDGLAVAPAQFLSTGLAGVETANTPFFNAVTFGLDWTYGNPRRIR